MSVEVIISTARNGRPVLSVKAFDAKECYETACRVNAWLDKACPNWAAYKNPAKRDISNPDLFYCVVPLQHNGWAVPPQTIQALFAAMQKAGLCYEYHIQDARYILEEEVDDLVSPFDGIDLDSLSVTQLKKLAKEHGVRFGSKFRKQEMIEALQDHLVIKR